MCRTLSATRLAGAGYMDVLSDRLSVVTLAFIAICTFNYCWNACSFRHMRRQNDSWGLNWSWI